MIDKLKQIWQNDSGLIIAGAVMLLGPELLRGRGRPSRIMGIVQIAGLGVLGYVVYKNRSVLGF